MVGPDSVKEVTQGVEIHRSDRVKLREMVTDHHTWHFLVYLANNLVVPTAVTLLSAYLYDKLKGKANVKLKIEGIEVLIDKGEIEKILVKKSKVLNEHVRATAN
jgi:hypothetical protein